MSNFDSNIIKNPEIFEQNRLAAHSDHVCYKNELERISPWLLVALRQLIMTAKTGMKSGFRHISRWKAMTCQSIRIPHIRGRLMSL